MLAKNEFKSKFVSKARAIPFDGADLWSFGNNVC